jgi:hypothetical protein
MAERLMAQSVDNVLSPITFPSHSYLTTNNSDAGNLLSNGLFASNNGSLPTSWSTSGGPSTTVVGAFAGILGNALSVTPTSQSSQNLIGSPTVSSGFSVGDTIFAGFKLAIAGNETNGANPQMGFRCTGNGAYWAVDFNAQAVDTSGVIEVNAEFTIPAGQGITGFQFQINSGTNGCNETITVGQVTLRNLTAGGLVIP